MTTTRLLCAAALLLVAGVILFASLRFWPRIAPFLQRRPAPVKHEGATEKYGAELKAAAETLPSPDLIRPAEQMVADHEALNEITKALDDFDRNVSNAISRFLRNQPTVLLRLPSSIEHTGEMPVVELVGVG